MSPIGRLKKKVSSRKCNELRRSWNPNVVKKASLSDYVKAFVKGADMKGWFGLEIHIHLLPEQARIPLQVMAVYNIKEQEK